MNEITHKQRMQMVFAALADGDGRPFVEAMADDLCWTIAGHGRWAGTWCGKEVVRTQLLEPLFRQFAGVYRNRARRIVVDGDMVVVECRGEVATKTGHRYDNHYCYVIEMQHGRMHTLTEYMDTALAEAVLTPPA
jgi:uncharacterized protein